MLLLARIIVIVVAGCVGIITVDARSNRSGGNNDVIKEDCSVCGVSNNGFLTIIQGGSTAKGGFRYPWMVSFRADKDYNHCGGAIIDQFHILTAAHCVKDVATGELSYNLKIYFQTSSRKQLSRGFGIDKIIIHPKHGLIDTKGEVQIAKYDIALVKLKNKIKCDAYKNPICLPDVNFKVPPNAKSEIAGWGPPNKDDIVPKPPLTHGAMKNLNFAKCISAVPEAKKIKDHMLCGGGTKQTMCYGDSGGPLMYKVKQKYYAVGIASSETNPSCPLGSPVIFTNVIKFIDWIQKNKKTSYNYLTGGKSKALHCDLLPNFGISDRESKVDLVVERCLKFVSEVSEKMWGANNSIQDAKESPFNLKLLVNGESYIYATEDFKRINAKVKEEHS